MNELIKITDQNGKKVVSARELYNKLGFDQSQWARWYKKNIIENEFAVENADYVPLDIMSSSNNGIMTKDFALSIDFAKKLAMLARTEAGEKIRDYFIQVEKAANGFIIPQSLPEALRLAAELAEKAEYHKKQLEAAQPKIAFADAVSASSNSILVRELAKLVAQNGYGIGQDRLFDWMVANRFLIRKKIFHASKNKFVYQYEPTQYSIQNGLLETLERVFGDGENGNITRFTVKVTGKGQTYFVSRIMKDYMSGGKEAI